jgi:energy-coupling factor transport system ATP-binding protein
MLDPVGRRDVLAIIDELNKKHGITVILITHHMNEAVPADRIIIMDAGEIVMEGTPREIFPDIENVHKLGLTVPQTVELISKLNKNGFDIPLENITLDECVDAIFNALS